MVLIFSNIADEETNGFIKWLNEKAIDYEVISKIDLSKIDIFLKTNYTEISLSEINNNFKINDKNVSFVFFRSINFVSAEVSQHKNFSSYVKDDILRIRDFFLSYLETFPHFGSIFADIYRNKIYELLVAKSVGFKIPMTLITSSKQSIVKKIGNEFILKNITNPYLKVNENKYQSTEKVISVTTDQIPDNFLSSCAQNIILSREELRIFFYKNIFFGTLISKKDELDIDWRHLKETYQSEYSIPNKLMSLLKNYISKIGINTGSFDIIKSNNDFIFVECNPLGKFAFTFELLGYNIYDKIYDTKK